ncbi:unnamed protein product [Owenia fusiformis]|uniref:Uncharacterized protein n=1 Tax=Owenia fusiformis TaxID=6347 RepID=A0A8J1TJD6_OWEFU|nr:unnamed protein product [Owenia fusiformis]
MKIQKISAYQVDLPLLESSYNWSDGKSVQVFDSTVVKIDTDTGVTGFGEVCPLGPFYLPSYANGVRTGLKELGPHLLGLNPLELSVLNQMMDFHLKGHTYVKSAIDMACWDILGKVTGQSICTLMGGRFGESVQLYRAISQAPPEQMAANVIKYKAEGYTKFQLKCGGKHGDPTDDIARIKSVRAALDPNDVLVADTNTGWVPHQAVRVANAVAELDVYLEQPCYTYQECLSVRNRTSLPFILDENIDDITTLIRAYSDQACDVVNLKISKFGGLTKIKQARDLCVSLGIGMCLEDTWGGDIITAAIAHLAHSTPEKYRFSSTDFNSYNSVHVAGGVPKRENGRMEAPQGPGLGLTVEMDKLGDPVLEMS